MNVFTPVSSEYLSLPRCQVLFRPQGKEKYINLGDVETFNLTPNLTEISRYSKEYSAKTLCRSDVVQKEMTISLTLMHLTPQMQAALYMSESAESYLVQAAVVAGSKTISGIEPGDIISLGASDVTVSGIESDDNVPVPYVLGMHFRVDRRSGFVEILAVPSTAGDGAVVSFTAPEIAATAKRQNIGIMSGSGIKGELFARGVGDIGPQQEVTLWSVELRPSGDIEIQGGDDYRQVQLSGKVYADGTQAAGFEFGRVRDIPKTALA
jgi:hypothetical protein